MAVSLHERAQSFSLLRSRQLPFGAEENQLLWQLVGGESTHSGGQSVPMGQGRLGIFCP